MFTKNNDIPTIEESIKTIETLLLSLDVSSFTREYEDNGDISSLYFVITEGKVPVRLPMYLDRIIKTLRDDIKLVKRKTKHEIREIAEKIMFAQLAQHIEIIATMIKNDQLTLKEAFLAFTYNQVKGKTFYELLEQKGINLIEE